MEAAGPVPATVGSLRAMPRAAFFSDMDDTFLATDKSLVALNMEALDALGCRGLPFVPCTGRAWAAVPRELLAHPAVRYVVGANGAVVRDVRRGETVREASLDPACVRALLGRLGGVDCSFDLFTPEGVLSERARYERLGAYIDDAPSLGTVRASRHPQDLTTEQLIAGHPHIQKLTLYWKDESDRRAIRDAVEMDGALGLTTSHPKNWEVMAAGVSKGSGLAFVCGLLGVGESAAVAFGDSPNDIPMLTRAGDGVAVANATAETRGAARHVTSSNDEGGVGRYILDLLGRWT